MININTTFIIIIIFVFLSSACYLKKNKIPFFNKQVSGIKTLSEIAMILTLIYGIFSYTHTIYPVFEKEHRLIVAEQNVSTLQELLDNERTLRKHTEKNLDMQTQIYKDISNQYIVLRNEKFDIERKLNDSEMKLKLIEKRAVYYLVIKEIHGIANMDIYSSIGKYSEKNLQEEAINLANKNLKDCSQNSIEYKAYSILKKFAEENLTDKSTYKEVFNMYTYFYTVYDTIN